MQQRLLIPEPETTCKVSRVALQTLGVLARDMRPAARQPLESYLAQMQAAVLNPQRTALDKLILEMRTALIPPAEIAENYVPTVARRLGVCWVQDTLNFRMVSIGSARLQSLLWRLEDHADDYARATAPDAPKLLVGVPEGCQHTLGATVLVGQLRRRGIGVRFELELAPSLLDNILGTQGYAGVLISASTRESLASLTDLVNVVRLSQPAMPVFIGGNVLEQDVNIEQMTGADLATSEVDVVLDACRLERTQDTTLLQDAG